MQYNPVGRTDKDQLRQLIIRLIQQFGGGGSMTGAQIATALDTYFGSTVWQGGTMTAAQIEATLDAYYGNHLWADKRLNGIGTTTYTAPGGGINIILNDPNYLYQRINTVGVGGIVRINNITTFTNIPNGYILCLVAPSADDPAYIDSGYIGGNIRLNDNQRIDFPVGSNTKIYFQWNAFDSKWEEIYREQEGSLISLGRHSGYYTNVQLADVIFNNGLRIGTTYLIVGVTHTYIGTANSVNTFNNEWYMLNGLTSEWLTIKGIWNGSDVTINENDKSKSIDISSLFNKSTSTITLDPSVDGYGIWLIGQSTGTASIIQEIIGGNNNTEVIICSNFSGTDQYTFNSGTTLKLNFAEGFILAPFLEDMINLRFNPLSSIWSETWRSNPV